ncbi:MAG: polysaccharide pyruvyl transferase WcaK-like protein [Chlamydiales bacterium]|jgi:polysaccharide pyruvyl transferase WcaK-like protein
MRIVLAGGYDTCNLGDHAMLQVLMRDFERRGERVQVSLLSRHPDPAFDTQYGVTSIPNLDHASREAARGKVFRGLNGEADDTDLIELTRRIAEADVLVVGGGRMLVDYTHGFQRGHLAYFALLVTLARCHGTRISLFAQSLEELATESGREHLRYIVRNADHVSLRETSSLEVLRALDPELIDERVVVLPDPAFGLEPVEPYAGPKLPRLDPKLPVLALNLRSYAWRDGAVGEFEGRLARWLDELRSARALQLLFVPQMTYRVDRDETDDRVIARRVAAAMRDQAGVHFIEDPLTVDEALGVYQHATALLTMRRHGALFAATQGVPVMPLSCEANTDYMARSLGIEDCCIDLSDGSSPRSVRRALSLLEQPQSVGRSLQERCRDEGVHVSAYADEIIALGQARCRPEGVPA